MGAQNKEFVVASAVTGRTATFLSPTITNNGFIGFMLTINITANAGAITLMPNFGAVGDGVIGATFTNFGTSTVSANYFIHPSLSDSLTGTTQRIGRILPFKFVVQIIHSAANAIDYSATGQFLAAG